MDLDPLDLPTSPTISPVPQAQSSWPGSSGDQPPGGRPQWTLLAVIGAGLAVVLILALVLTLLLSARGETTTVLLGAAELTATSVQATSTSEGTPPTSPTGTAGTSGPHATATPRPPGPAVHVVSAQGTTPLTASCPTDELALSGGWTSTNSVPISSSSRKGNGWMVHAPSSSGALIGSYVMCLLRVSGATITERSAGVIIDPGANTVAATCATDEVLAGGGLSIASAPIAITHFSPTADHTGFSVTAVSQTYTQQNANGAPNHSPAYSALDVYAECLSAPKAHLTVPAPAQQSISPHASGSVQISCPKDTLLSGGGIDLLNGVAVATKFAPISATTWQAQVQNQTIVSTTVKLYALCLSFS